MNQYPAKPIMDEMAKHGRYGDSMLVHMNPVEVAGIASLTPGGLTTNPVTGQPEAFAFLAPMLLGAAGISMTPLASAALVGGITAIQEKDIGKGLLAGIGGLAGGAIGDKLGKLFGTASDAATQTTLNTGLDAAKTAAQTGIEAAANTSSTISDVGFQQAMEGASGTLEAGMERALSAPMSPSPITQSVTEGLVNVDELAGVAPENLLRGAPLDMASPAPSIASRINEGVSNLGTMGNLGILGASQGALGDIEMREQAEARGQAMRDEAEKERKGSFKDLQRSYAAHGIPTGLSEGRSEMSYRTPPPMYMEEGGSTSKKEDDNPYAQQSAFLGDYRGVARFLGGPRGYAGIDPVTVQQTLRGPDTIAPPRDYMPGFEPEFNYFQDVSEGISMPDRSYRPMRQGVISRSQYFDPILQSPQSNAQMNEYRRTLEKMDPGPLDIGSVMGLASEGSTLSTPQQNVVEEYAAPDFSTAQTERLKELMDRGMSLEEAIANQEFAISKGYDLNGDGVVTNEEFSEATAKTETNTADQTATGNTNQPDFVSGFDVENFDFNKFASMYPDLADFNLSTLRFQGGGEVPEVMLQTSLGSTSVPAGGIAQVPTEFTEASEQQKRLNKMTGLPFGEESEGVKRDIQALEAAVLGEVDESLAEQITNMFVEKYGPDIYRVARQSILRRSTPNAQTEGMINGEGSGMDDMVQGMIGSEQPVAVSPGEFIVPADVVSGLGEGSSDAGAKKLDDMMGRVRMERNGTTRQAPPIDERKVMPA